MRLIIEFVLIVIFFILSWLFSKPDVYGGFICNIAYSTASACVFYFAFTIVPDFLKFYTKIHRYLECLVSLFECCVNFDIYYRIVSDRIFVGYGGGYSSKVITNDQAKPNSYIFKGKILRLDKGLPDDMVDDFCHSLNEILTELELIGVRIEPIAGLLSEIQSKVINQIHSRKPYKGIQPFRSSVWRKVEDIYLIVADSYFYSKKFESILLKRKLTISVKHAVNK